MNIVDLREKRAKLWKGMEAFLDSKRNENGVLSKEDDIYTRFGYSMPPYKKSV